jgi:hypothetical protein
MLAFACMLPLVAAAEDWHGVSGTGLRALFSDKEFADGVHFAYRFKADGSFTGTEMAKDVTGSWRVRGDELCWSWRGGPSECYQVQRDGAHVRMLINGSEAWYGTLEPLR